MKPGEVSVGGRAPGADVRASATVVRFPRSRWVGDVGELVPIAAPGSQDLARGGPAAPSQLPERERHERAGDDGFSAPPDASAFWDGAAITLEEPPAWPHGTTQRVAGDRRVDDSAHDPLTDGSHHGRRRLLVTLPALAALASAVLALVVLGAPRQIFAGRADRLGTTSPRPPRLLAAPREVRVHSRLGARRTRARRGDAQRRARPTGMYTGIVAASKRPREPTEAAHRTRPVRRRASPRHPAAPSVQRRASSASPAKSPPENPATANGAPLQPAPGGGSPSSQAGGGGCTLSPDSGCLP